MFTFQTTKFITFNKNVILQKKKKKKKCKNILNLPEETQEQRDDVRLGRRTRLDPRGNAGVTERAGHALGIGSELCVMHDDY